MCKRVLAQGSAVLVDLPIEGCGLQRAQMLAVFVHQQLHQPPGGVVGALVYMNGALYAVGTGDCNGLGYAGAVLLGQGAGRILHHAVKYLVGLLAGQYLDDLVVHAQQQSDGLPYAAACQGGQLIGSRRGGDGVLGACHRHRCGGAGGGGDRRDAACGFSVVDPQRAGGLAVIVDIIGGKLGLGRHLVVAVRSSRSKGQGSALSGHKRPLHPAEQHRAQVNFAVGDGQTQGAGVGSPLTVEGGQGVVQQDCTLFQGYPLAFLCGQTAAQAQGAGFVQLCIRETAPQLGYIIPQQAQGHGAALFQGQPLFRTERAVCITAHPAVLHGSAYIRGIRRAAVQVQIQPSGGVLGIDAVALRRKCSEHPGKLAPGQG